MRGCNFLNILPVNVSKGHRGKVLYCIKKRLKSLDYYYVDSGSYPSSRDNIKAINLFQEKHNHSESCITFDASRITQKLDIYLAVERLCPAFFNTDSGHVFWSTVGNEFAKNLRRKRPKQPTFVFDIFHIHSLKLFTDLKDNNIVGMNYQTSINLKFTPLFKFPFQSLNIDLRDTSCEKIPVVCVGITRFALMLRKESSILFWRKRRYKMVAARQVETLY